MKPLTFAQKENIGFQYVLDAMRPCSPYGQELLRDLTPFGPEQRQELLRQFYNIRQFIHGRETCRKELDQLLRIFMSLKMVRQTAKKCQETDLNEIELFEIKRFLLQSQEIFDLFSKIQPMVQLQGISLEDTRQALDILDPEGNRVASFHIPDSASPLLAQLRRDKRTAEQAGDAPQRAELASREAREEQRIRSVLSQNLRPHMDALLRNMDTIADLDLTAEKARIAKLYGAAAPILTEKNLQMQDMVNPRIADLLKNQGKVFAPVSITLEPGATVITGANMGGKSVALKTIALNILLVHCGFFPFAKDARLPLFDGLHIISEDLESIDRGLSSFGGEMVRFSGVISQLREGFHFLLLDEFARGTNPQEGAAIVRAVTRYLNGQNVIAVLATHFDHVAPWAKAHYQVAGLRDLNWEELHRELAALGHAAGAEQIAKHMNYGLFRVDNQRQCPKDALNICRLLGMPSEIMEEAEKTMASGAEIC